MARSYVLSAALLFACTVQAVYDKVFFSSKETEWKCPGWVWDCPAPLVCAHQSLLDKFYCCAPGASDALCWAGASNCGGGEGEPATSQIGCSEGANAFCCLSEREECTQKANEINICWATPSNPVANISRKKINETFSSLSSANPSAASWTFIPEELLTTSTPAPSSATETTTSAAPTADQTLQGNPNPSDESDSDSNLSGGAIGGIVVGVVGGLTAVGVGAFFLLRRRRNKHVGTELNSKSYSNNPHNGPKGYGAAAQTPPHEMDVHQATHEAPASHNQPPVEMPSYSRLIEMEGSQPRRNAQP